MLSQYSDNDIARGFQTIESVRDTIAQLIEWNKIISSADDFYGSLQGTQLLAANCTLITAIGEGVNRINRILPGFLHGQFPDIPWHAIVAMRNHIAHGYFEIDAEIVFDTISSDMPGLLMVFEQLLSFPHSQKKS